MRWRVLSLLILMAGALAVAPQARADTVSYYGLKFDGVDDYVEVTFANPLDIDEVTYVVLFNDSEWGGAETYLEGRSSDNYAIFRLHSTTWTNGRLHNEHYGVNGGFSNVRVAEETFRGAPHLVAVTYVNDFSTNTTTVKGYLDGVLVNERVSNAPKGRDLATLYIAKPLYASAKYYLVLIYNRALSDEEIQQIYNDPLNPPTDGLVLWYAPDSVDTVNRLWKDKSGNGNDGTIYGNPTAERILISRINARDAKRGFLLSPVDYTVTDEYGTQYIPSFVTFPYDYLDKYITINVSAPNYYSTITQVQPPFQNVTIDIYPIPTYVTLAKTSLVVHAKPSNEGGIMSFPFFDLFKFWPGGNIGVDIMRFNIRGAIVSFFNDTTIPLFGPIVAILIWAGGTFLAWNYSKEPEFTAVWGYLLYVALTDFIIIKPYMDLMRSVIVPFAFVIALLYAKKVADVFGGA